MAADARFIALRDRAYALLSTSGPVTEAALLAHVYGGSAPAALTTQLIAPLLGDPRFERRDDGTWARLGAAPRQVVSGDYTALALATTGASPGRGRIVCVVALAVHAGRVVERFMATVAPGARVPRYVAERLGLDAALLESLQPFETIVDALAHFLGKRPIVAQDAALTWGFVSSEARRVGRVLADPPLVDINDLATRALALDRKPTLARVAAHLGVSTVRITAPEEEARVLVAVANRLLPETEPLAQAAHGARVLQRGATARAMPDAPGVYTMLDAEAQPLYVGKARRLRSRVAAYVHRPLGATRRLEGLLAAVSSVERHECATDLEALVLEDREIRRLAPRFNTVRQQRAPRLWIRLPPRPEPRRAPRRLELSAANYAPGEYVGPFRNETAAEASRALAREVFELDALRRGSDAFLYESRLVEAWAFLHGERATAEALARQRSVRLLRTVVEFEVETLLLPADPRSARYAVVRPAPLGIEAFVIDRGVCVGWRVTDDTVGTAELAAIVQAHEPRTTEDDVSVVLRWLGAQRRPARVLCLPDDPLAAADAVQDAASALLEARAASREDMFDPFADAALDAGDIG